jgi:hypothetical protein
VDDEECANVFGVVSGSGVGSVERCVHIGGLLVLGGVDTWHFERAHAGLRNA